MGSGHSHDHASNAHSQGHTHGHGHAPADFGNAFAIGVVLNTAFVVIEATYGYLAGSMALVADAGHNLSDVLSLLLAWGASILAKRAPSERFTYGLKSSTILAAMANAGLLLIALGAILFETLNRFSEPAPVAGMTMVIIAGIGIAINTGTALLFMRGRKHDLNIRGAFLHMAADALVSVGVVVAGIAILMTGAWWIDPVTSLIIVAIIAWGTWGLLKDSVKMGLLAVPEGIEECAVRSYLTGLPGVAAVHDLHIWAMSTTETALTAHLVMPDGTGKNGLGDAFLSEISEHLAHDFRIGHSTIQIEETRDCTDRNNSCTP